MKTQKIERIELALVEMPYVHFFETSLGREDRKTCILIKVFSNGICGYGEVVADNQPMYSYETNGTAWIILVDFLIPMIFREDIASPDEYYQEAARYRGHPMAKAGLELALWDLLAKKKNLPLFELYGGTKTEVLSGVSIGIQNTIPQLLDRMSSFLDLGYPRVKVKIKPGWDIQVCQAVRARFPHTELQVDANAAYSLADKNMLLELDEFDLQMIEQPFAEDDLYDHSLLQQDLRTAVCLDESAKSAEVVRKALAMHSCRIVNIKVGRVGGIIEARKIHDLCQANEVPVWCGGMLETGIGRAHNLHLASLPNFCLANDISASRRYYAEDLIEPAVDITNRGTIQIPQGPGIGVSPQEDRIKKVTLKREKFLP